MKTKNKKRPIHRKRNNPLHNIQNGGGQQTVNALTYNLSWASQQDVERGSEADFVAQCKRVKRNCYQQALKKIKELHYSYKFDVIGIQEVVDPNLVAAICRSTGLTGWYRGATWKSIEQIWSECAIIWNTHTLGTMETGKTINLAKVDENNNCDARTCCIVTTSYDYNLIVAHFPWLNRREDILAITEIIDAHISSNGPIIILADTNDAKTLITKDFPLIIKNRKLSHGLSKEEAREVIKSCCWHEKDHKWPHLTDTGDYILSENVPLIKVPLPYPSNESSETELYSDHMPVVATVILQHNRATSRNNTRKLRARSASAQPYRKKTNTIKSRTRIKSIPF